MGIIEIIFTLFSIVAIIVVIIVVYNYFSNMFTSAFKWMGNIFGGINSVKPCGGDCYNDQICDEQINKCRKKCNTGETYNTGADLCCNITTHEIINKVCVPKCPPGQQRCGNTNCIDPKTESCLDGQVCQNKFVLNTMPKKCCGKENEKQLYPNHKEGKCIDCPGKPCGSSCCPKTEDQAKESSSIFGPSATNKHPGTQCVNGIECCDPKFVGKDSNTGIEMCCQKELCGGKCCSGNRTCNKDANGNEVCQIKCGNEFCPDDSDLCVDNNGTSKCYPSSCKWGQSNYEPPPVYDKTGNVQKLNSVCNVIGLDELKPKIAVSSITNNMTSKTTIDLDDDETNERCKTLDACLGKIQQSGLEDLKFKSINSQTINASGDGMCSGDINCSKLLPTMDKLKTIYKHSIPYKETSCPAKNKDGKDDTNCCYHKGMQDKTLEDGQFNGYVCPEGAQCYNGADNDTQSNNNQYCYKSGNTDNKNYNLGLCSFVTAPTIENNKISCICPEFYKGKRCQFDDINTCRGQGEVMTDKNDNPICICDAGYTGTNCENIIILKETDIQRSVGGVISAFCNGCHIVGGPGVLNLKLVAVKGDQYQGSNLYIGWSSQSINGRKKGAGLEVHYSAKYKKRIENTIKDEKGVIISKKLEWIELPFSGKITLTHCTDLSYGYYPQVLGGTDNYVVQSASFGGFDYYRREFGGGSAAVVVLGIPVLDDVMKTRIFSGKEIRYLDWDNYDCGGDEPITTKYSGFKECHDDPDREKCCPSNKSYYGFCDYTFSPCGDARKGIHLSKSNPAFNKSIVQSKGVGGYYYA